MLAATIILLVSCLLLGGATRAAMLTETSLQIAAVPVLLLAVWRLLDEARRRDLGSAIFALLAAALCAAQLLPLPPSLWQALPMRDEVKRTFEVIGDTAPWFPVSLTPSATWLSALSLLPPLAMYFASLALPPRQRRRLVVVVIAAGVGQVVLSWVQFIDGPASILRPYEITGHNDPVGLFATRDHLAVLLGLTLILSAPWAIDCAARARMPLPDPADPADAGASMPGAGSRARWQLAGWLAFAVAILTTAALIRSGLGMLLPGLALLAVFGIALRDERLGPELASIGGLVMMAAAVAGVWALSLSMFRVLGPGPAPIGPEPGAIQATTWRALTAVWPVGSGLGSYPRLYGVFERTEDVTPLFVNRANNDLLEFLVETGGAGAMLVALFLFAALRAGRRAWSRAYLPAPSALDAALVRAASLAVFLVIGLSLVHYPLRSTALASVAMLCCALVFGREERAAVAPAWPASAPADVPAPALPDGAAARDGSTESAQRQWGADVAWPSAWRADAGDDHQG